MPKLTFSLDEEAVRTLRRVASEDFRDLPGIELHSPAASANR